MHSWNPFFPSTMLRRHLLVLCVWVSQLHTLRVSFVNIVWLVGRVLGVGLWRFSMLCVLLLHFGGSFVVSFVGGCFVRDLCWRQFCGKVHIHLTSNCHLWCGLKPDVATMWFYDACSFFKQWLHICGVLGWVRGGHDANPGPCNVNANFVHAQKPGTSSSSLLLLILLLLLLLQLPDDFVFMVTSHQWYIMQRLHSEGFGLMSC